MYGLTWVHRFTDYAQEATTQLMTHAEQEAARQFAALAAAAHAARRLRESCHPPRIALLAVQLQEVTWRHRRQGTKA